MSSKRLETLKPGGYISHKGKPKNFIVEGKPLAIVTFVHSDPEPLWGAVSVDDREGFTTSVRKILRNLYPSAEIDVEVTWLSSLDEVEREHILDKTRGAAYGMSNPVNSLTQFTGIAKNKVITIG